jgi:hypothetical protein
MADFDRLAHGVYVPVHRENIQGDFWSIIEKPPIAPRMNSFVALGGRGVRLLERKLGLCYATQASKKTGPLRDALEWYGLVFENSAHSILGEWSLNASVYAVVYDNFQ